MAEVLAVTRTYELIVWAVPQVNKFPKDHRFGLGNRIVDKLYDLLELLLEASYARDKTAALQEANSKVNTLRYMFRLAKDMNVLSINRSFVFRPLRSSLRCLHHRLKWDG